MTALLLFADPLLIALLVGVWGWAGLRAGGLRFAADPRDLRRRAGRLLVLVTVGLLLAAARLALVGWLSGAGWWFVQEKVVLALPLLGVGVAATALLSLPRLARLRVTAATFAGVDTIPPSLRLDAASPRLVVPLQATAVAALAGWIVFLFVGYPVTPGAWFTVVTTVALAVGYLARRSRIAARRSALARAVRAAGLASSLTLAAVATAVLALVVTAPRAAAAHPEGIDVSLLQASTSDTPDRSFTLTARHTTLTRADGSTVEALAYNGTVPGPELRVRQGELVEVVLRNADIAEGVTIHWHGYDVPNAADGVPGVTQETVKIGSSYVYRFVAHDAGTYWYHSHENSRAQVAAGLYGLLIVEPTDAAAELDGVDLAVAVHELAPPTTAAVEPGTRVRLRLANANTWGAHVALPGVTATLTALDGTDLHGPAPVANPGLRLAAGGRADFTFTMPPHDIAVQGTRLTLAGGATAPGGDVTEIDPLHYGTPVGAGPFTAFDRDYALVLDEKVTRVNGVPTFGYTVNGRAFPEIPTQVVSTGDRVKLTVVARGFEPHPMHPHGHHVLVLSRNGVAPTGSPLWLDTFEVLPGEVWEVAFLADNPGIWMDHCHDLRHAEEGMVLHLAYEGYRSPFSH